VTLDSEAALTEALDEAGLLADARGPGTYAVAVDVPDSVEAVKRAWEEYHDVHLNDGAVEQLADADRVAYVGASRNVYARLSDHVTGARRSTAFLTVFSPERVVDVWPAVHPYALEVSTAMQLANDGWVAYCDGEVWA